MLVKSVRLIGASFLLSLAVTFATTSAAELREGAATAATARAENGTREKTIVDSRMSKKEAFDGLDPKCPPEIRDRQRVVKLKYYSFDGKIHQGQLVIDKDLVKDIKKVFKFARREKFPINSVIPK